MKLQSQKDNQILCAHAQGLFSHAGSHVVHKANPKYWMVGRYRVPIEPCMHAYVYSSTNYTASCMLSQRIYYLE